MGVILTVDDSSSLRQMVSFTLKSNGHTVVEACDGVDGLQAVKARDFDLVVTDINMPIMDGLTLIREIRYIPKYRHTPLIVLTAESDPDLLAQGNEAGATGWIVKPFDPVILKNAVDRALR